ncbi:hypothetical protein BD324DRAFT_678740 [Kockovaella imperatae]|uniref:Uncharacterized protein n=1 Tax=Kockovaella imperatae TaxID=4999 RepID=A0A1Y1UR60_9TREE|nr:hypothetical protein BD324DRAFT_678740 [Kockovaella imperatae]ORX39625.1 hypothetical protein BD324DRAFT_678740 [Kockovaella imperatae]
MVPPAHIRRPLFSQWSSPIPMALMSPSVSSSTPPPSYCAIPPGTEAALNAPFVAQETPSHSPVITTGRGNTEATATVNRVTTTMPPQVVHHPGVGPSGFLDWPAGHLQPSATDELEAFLRLQSSGPYPRMPHEIQRETASRGQSVMRFSDQRTSNGQGSCDPLHRSVSNPGSGRTHTRQVHAQELFRAQTMTRNLNQGPVARAGPRQQPDALHMRNKILASNPLATISSHHSQEGQSGTESTITRASSTRRQRGEMANRPISRVDPNAVAGMTPMRTEETVSAPRAVDLKVVEGHEDVTREGEAHRTKHRNRSGAGARQSTVHHDGALKQYSGCERSHRKEANVERPPTPPPKDGTVAASAQDESATFVPRRGHGATMGGGSDNTYKWVLYDDQGNVRRIWNLEYDGDSARRGDHQASAARTTETGAQRTRAKAGRCCRDSSSGDRHRASTSSRTEAVTATTESFSRSSPSQTSTEVASCLSIFEAQEHISALEAELDFVRSEMMKQRNSMMCLPHDQIQAALQVRVDMKGLLSQIQEEIAGWQEVVQCLKGSCQV